MSPKSDFAHVDRIIQHQLDKVRGEPGDRIVLAGLLDKTVPIQIRSNAVDPVIRDGDDTAEVFDILNLKSVNIYGVSLGGMISQTIAAKRKDLVNSIVLCSTASRLSENSLKIINEWIKLAKEKNMSELMDSFARNIYSEKFYLKNKAVFPEFGKMATDKDIENFIILAEAIDSLTDMTGNIKCPAFVIGAENDKIFSAESSVELAEKLNAEYYIYKEYGHAVYDEAKDCPQKAGDFFRRFL